MNLAASRPTRTAGPTHRVPEAHLLSQSLFPTSRQTGEPLEAALRSFARGYVRP